MECYLSLCILCEVDRVIFAFRTREGITLGHVVVCTVLHDIMYRHAIHVDQGVRKYYKAHINIYGETLNYERSEWLVYGHHSGYSGWNNWWIYVIIFLWNSPHACHEEINRFILIICSTSAIGESYFPKNISPYRSFIAIYNVFVFHVYFAHTTTLFKKHILESRAADACKCMHELCSLFPHIFTYLHLI
jgi:hypothetical protein